MGAVLALRLAALHRPRIAGVASSSVMLELPAWQVRLAAWLARLRRDRLPRSFHIGDDLDRAQVCSEVVEFARAVPGDTFAPACPAT